MTHELTDEQIDSMAAGPSMDIAIAQFVIGSEPCDAWKLQRHSEFGPVHHKSDRACNHKRCHPAGNPHTYSSNMEAAWLVIREMNARNCWCYVGVLSSIVYCTFDDKQQEPFRSEARIDEEALAICRAALKAVRS